MKKLLIYLALDVRKGERAWFPFVNNKTDLTLTISALGDDILVQIVEKSDQSQMVCTLFKDVSFFNMGHNDYAATPQTTLTYGAIDDLNGVNRVTLDHQQDYSGIVVDFLSVSDPSAVSTNYYLLDTQRVLAFEDSVDTDVHFRKLESECLTKELKSPSLH